MTDRPTPLDPPAPDEDAGESSATGGERQPDRADEVDGAPERRRVVVALWENPRRRWALVAGAVVVVAAVVAAVIVASSGAGRPVPSGAMPTLGSQFATPPSVSGTSTPATPATLPAYPGAPLWTLRPAGGTEHEVPKFAVTEHGFVLVADEQILGVDQAGKQVWSYAPADADDFEVRVTGPRVFVSYANPNDDRWPQPKIIIALDSATGKEIWRADEASFWSVTTDTIYLSVCYGGQNDHVGDCTLSARDPRTNAIRWSAPTYASSRVENGSSPLQAEPTPPVLLVGAYRTGADTYSAAAHDPATGALLGRGFENAEGDVPSIDLVSDRSVVTIDDHDENPANGCTATLTGFSVYGATQTWQYTARTAKTDDGLRCGEQPDSFNGGKLGVTAENGAPSVLNLDTGAIEWSAPTKGVALAAGGSTLLTVESTEDGNRELVAYRVGNADPIWRAPFTGDVDSGSVVITDTVAVVADYGSGAVGYDLKSGKAWSYGESMVSLTDTAVVACQADACSGYAIG